MKKYPIFRYDDYEAVAGSDLANIEANQLFTIGTDNSPWPVISFVGGIIVLVWASAIVIGGWFSHHEFKWGTFAVGYFIGFGGMGTAAKAAVRREIIVFRQGLIYTEVSLFDRVAELFGDNTESWHGLLFDNLLYIDFRESGVSAMTLQGRHVRNIATHLSKTTKKFMLDSFTVAQRRGDIPHTLDVKTESRMEASGKRKVGRAIFEMVLAVVVGYVGFVTITEVSDGTKWPVIVGTAIICLAIGAFGDAIRLLKRS